MTDDMRTAEGVLAPASASHRRREPLSRAMCALALMLGGAGCSGDIVSAPSTPLVASLTVTATQPPSIALDHGLDLHAVARDNLGAVVDKPTLTWTSSDPSVAVGSRSGGRYSTDAIVQGKQVGVATITAHSGTVSAGTTITVHGPGPAAIVYLTVDSPLPLGRAVKVQVGARDSDNVQLRDLAPTFASTDTSVLSVSSSGLLVARAEGVATLSAVVDGKSASRTITVRAGDRAFLWTAATGLTDLGVLPGYATSRAYAVSAAGHVAGTIATLGDSLLHAFVRAPGANAAMRDLGGLAGNGASEAFGVNSTGQVVGYAQTATGSRHGVLWSPSGDVQDLGILTGTRESVALAINDAGQVVGWSGTEQGRYPFLWTATGGMQALNSRATGAAYAISANGTVAGQSNEQPFVWKPGTSGAALQIFPGDSAGTVVGINDAGEAVGSSIGCSDLPSFYYYDDCYSPTDQPVFWETTASPGAQPMRVGNYPRSAPADKFWIVSGINGNHQVVGTGGHWHATLWSAALGYRDLGALARRWASEATAINDAGVVVGWSGNP